MQRCRLGLLTAREPVSGAPRTGSCLWRDLRTSSPVFDQLISVQRTVQLDLALEGLLPRRTVPHDPVPAASVLTAPGRGGPVNCALLALSLLLAERRIAYATAFAFGVAAGSTESNRSTAQRWSEWHELFAHLAHSCLVVVDYE